jgi:hypothetical protein
MAPILVPALLSGCYRHATLDMKQLDEREHYETETTFRVTTMADHAVSLDSVTIRTDSVIGRLPNGTRTAIARADVFRIEQRKPDVFKTVLGGARLGLAMILIVAFFQMGPL